MKARWVTLAVLIALGSTAAAEEERLPYRHGDGPRKYLEWAWKDPVNFFRWDRRTGRQVGIGAGVTLGSSLFDESVRSGLADSESPFFDDVRDAYGNRVEGYAALLFAGGLLAGNERLADTGFFALEATIYARLMSGALKELTGRERPRDADDPWQLRGPAGSGTSFVSGDAAAAFAFASAVREGRGKPWLTGVLYGLATLVALQRIDSQAHWLSDVVGGALLGHSIGRRVVRLHERGAPPSRLQPLLGPGTVGFGYRIGRFGA